MKIGRTSRLAVRFALGLSLLATAAGGDVRPAFAQSSSVCTVVKLTLGQSAALEREAFKAQLVLTNNQADAPLSNLAVTISIKDVNGRPVDALFFNKVTDLTGVTAVDGSGTMQPASQATINWLIIPSPGAGGTLSAGSNYNVSAQISYVAGGVPSTNATQDAGITVFPQPLLAIEYALPFEVFGVDPFTLTGTTEPFPLGLRVTNVGAGTANNFQVASAQPTITDNKQGLPINFQILGTFVGSNPLNTNSLTIPFGNIAPGVTSLAAWDMTASYSGRFIDFNVGFTHAASLGGALTSLIQGVSTYTLIKDVFDDTPGHDNQFDLLVNTSTPRSQMEAGYQNGLEPKPDSIMESDRPGLVPVTNVPAHLVGTLSGSNAVVRFAFDQSAPTNTWVHASIPFPQGGTVPLVSAIRADGKTLNPHNAWIAKHIDKLTNTRTYFLHVLDFTGNQPSDYGLAFNAASLITPPDPISNLTVSAAAPGGLALSWNATGAAGSAGTIVGGQYAVFVSTDLSATPSVAAARVVFSTATPALARQDYLLSGLTGNATYQVAVFLANAAGQFSAASNKVVAQTLAAPPTAVQTVAVSSTAFTLDWSIASNSPGTPYQILLSSVAGLPGSAQTGFAVDPTSAAFAGLAPNKTYYASSIELNSAQVASPPAIIAAVTTLALPPGTTSPALIGASPTSVTAQWLPNNNPPDTEFWAELSTSPTRSPVLAASGWVRSSSYTFAGLPAGAAVYGQVKARNRALVETAYLDLGVANPAITVAAIAVVPSSTSLIVGTTVQFQAIGTFTDGSTRTISASWASDAPAVATVTAAGVATALGGGSAHIVASSGTASGTARLDAYLLQTSTNLVGGRPEISVISTAPFVVSQISTQTGAGFVALGSAAVQGLIAVSDVFDLRRPNLGDFATVTILFDPTVVKDTSTLALWRFDGVQWSSTTILNQVVSVSSGVGQVTGSLVATSFYGLFVRDVIPPVTTLAVGGPVYGGFVSSTTLFVFTAVDPLFDGGATGVAFTRYQINGGAFARSPLSFHLPGPDGAYTIGYQSQDVASNLEVLRSTTVLLDQTPPATTAMIGSPAYTAVDGTQYVTTTTPVAFYAVDPSSGSVASGVNRVEIAVDTPAFTAYVSSFTLAEGRHTILYRAVDNVGNVEAAHTLLLQADATPPNVTFQVLGSSFTDAAGNLDVSTATTFGLLSVDPLVNSVASGVRSTQYQINGGSFTVYSGTFSFAAPDGARLIAYQATDNVGNTSLLKSATVFLDVTPPVSMLSVGSPQYASSGTVYVSTLTPLALSAIDPLVNGVASGVRGISVAQNGSAFAAYAGTFTPTAPDGTKALSWSATDNVGNQEIVKSSAVVLDATPPQTSLALLGGRQYPGPDAASFYTSSATRFALLAADPLVNGAASGVAWTKYQDSTGAFLTYVSTFALAEGAHPLAYQSQDKVANLEVLRSTTALIDATPPVTTVSVGSPTYTAPDGTVYVTPASPVTFAAVDPVLPTGQAGSGVARIEVSVDSAAFTVYTASLTFIEGRHTVAYRSVDNVGNVEVTRILALQSDATPPVTSLAVSTPSFSGFVSAATLFSLSAVDPIVNGVASGVAFTRYRVNGGAFAASPLAFRLIGPDGAYQVDYQSQDNATNLEVLKSTAVFLDQTPPVTTPHIGAPNYVAADGTQYVTPATPVTFTAVDPSSGAVASGVNRIEAALDGGAFSVYAATLTFAEGRHTVLYRAVDNVGNVEATKTLSLQSDATPPITAFKASGTYFTVNAPEGPRLYAPLAFSYSLPATDPVVNNVASGLAFTRYRTGQLTSYASGAPSYTPGAFANYVSTFAFSEGIRRVDFQSQDNVANLELLKSATVFVDATPPATALTVGAPQYAAGGTLYVSTATPFTLASQDPVVQEVASGVAGIFFHLDANAFAPYSSTFTIPVPDGAHSASFYAADNVGNAETIKTSTVALDATPPQTSLAVLGGHQFPGPDARTFYASADTRFALPAVDPAIKGVASGVAWTRWQDNGGAFTAYLSTLSFAEGAHALGYQSQDNVQNLEVLRSTNAWIDATPPVTTVTIGSPTYTAADGTIYVTPATPVTFAASDPNLPTGQPGSGVNRIEVAIDGGPFAIYASSLTFAEGRHTILYRAVDDVANVEASHTLALQSDATPPVSSLVIGQPQYQLPNVLLVSSRTPFAVAAVDPVVNNVASGVKDTWYNWANLAARTSAFQQFAASFTLSGLDVNKVIAFYSRDNVFNTEVLKSSTVLLDSTPPEVALLSPGSCPGGICRVLKGRFPVLGTAKDLHFASYVLDFAPGQNASAGFVTIATGAVAVSSGTLGAWDASTLSGWQTLRLTATDLVANTSVLSINVYVGDPAALMLLGNHDVFEMPTGVAAGPDGKVYVADTNANRIAVFTATGAFVAAYGQSHGDRDDGVLSTSTVRLNKPKGVAVDAAGNIYVADTNNDRVLELSATGQFLLAVGRRQKRDRDSDDFHPGKNLGQFNKPSALALDMSGNIYVADTNNKRVQVLSSTGAPILAFSLPPLPREREDKDDASDRDDDRRDLGRPFGVAVDAAGRIYVADPDGSRALVYGATGQLLLTVPIAGTDHDGHDVRGRPEGIAVSTDGYCLLVSDSKLARVLKFDMNGAQNLSFGARARGDDDKRKTTGIAFRKPAGLALDAAGNLYVADRNAEKIEMFGLPNGQATLIVPPPGPGDDDTARDVVSREDGGTVERKDKAAVSIPAQALSDDLKVSVSTPTADVAAAGTRGAQDKDLKTASPPVDFGPEGTKFSAPVTLTLPYNPDLVAEQNGDESSLKVHYWNKDKFQWEDLASQVDAQKHTVTAKTTHFSLYQVFATSSSAVKPLATADPTFTYHDGYAFPNPVRGTSVVTLRIQPGLADSVEVHVYDLSGRKVHSSSNFTQNILDDGNGKGNQYTFDHVWDISGVGSGVYLYVITAKKAGMSDIHKTGRVGVIK